MHQWAHDGPGTQRQVVAQDRNALPRHEEVCRMGYHALECFLQRADVLFDGASTQTHLWLGVKSLNCLVL